MLGERNLEERLEEIRENIKRRDIRWDYGFFTNQDEYFEKRIKLHHELEQLTPVPDGLLKQAANILENFSEHWARLEGDPEAQRELVKLIVQRGISTVRWLKR